MKDAKNDIYQLIKKYFEIHLPLYTKRSANTIINYKKSINSYRLFLKDKKDIPFTKLTFDCFSKDLVNEYLVYLRDVRHNSPETLNLRLASIRAFIAFCSDEKIELGELYMSLKRIPRFKSSERYKVEYLTEKQLKSIFDTPNIETKLGRRNRFFIIFAYETGGRLQELIDLKLKDLETNGDYTIVRIHGKGDKTRKIPLLPETIDHLNVYLSEFHPDNYSEDFLFYTVHNNTKTQMKPGTVDAFLKKYAIQVQEKDSYFPKVLHCHMFRHSIAMAMYKKGVPISYIKDFLGHSSLESTKIYSYADDATIITALKSVNHEEVNQASNKKWKNHEVELLKFCGLE